MRAILLAFAYKRCPRVPESICHILLSRATKHCGTEVTTWKVKIMVPGYKTTSLVS